MPGLEERSTPNSRVLYVPIQAPGLEWQGALGELELLIESQGRLQRANPEVYLYFFAPSESDGFMEREVWVAVEIVGSPLLEEGGPVSSMDLDASTCLVHKSALGTFGELLESEARARRELERELGRPLAETWRVRLEGLRSAELQFFR